MKKLLLFGSLLILTGLGCNTTTGTFVNKMPLEPRTQTYRNGTYGFEFTYPKDFEFVVPSYPNLEDKIVQLQTSKEKFPKTNFGDAAFSVSAVYSKDLADCLKTEWAGKMNIFKDKIFINNVEFYLATSTDAGAGNLYESKLYRTLAGGKTCIELSEVIHTTNIYNYPEGTVTEIDKTSVSEMLDEITKSFRFTND